MKTGSSSNKNLRVFFRLQGEARQVVLPSLGGFRFKPFEMDVRKSNWESFFSASLGLQIKLPPPSFCPKGRIENGDTVIPVEEIPLTRW